jgi:hypothetical protein
MLGIIDPRNIKSWSNDFVTIIQHNPHGAFKDFGLKNKKIKIVSNYRREYFMLIVGRFAHCLFPRIGAH